MAKRQKLTTLQIEDLPNEMIVQVLCNLDIKDITNCGMVSKRFRAIYRDESLTVMIMDRTVKMIIILPKNGPNSSWHSSFVLPSLHGEIT